MRIGYYIPGWPPGAVANGIVTTLGNLGQQLREMGHQVYYITPSAPPDSQDENVLVVDRRRMTSLLSKLQFGWDAESALYRAHSNAIGDAVRELIRDHDIDIFQMEETHGWARNVIERVSIPVVVRLHGPWFTQKDLGHEAAANPENRNRVAREGKAISLAAGLTAPSKAVLDLTSSKYELRQGPRAVIPNPMKVKSISSRWDIERCDKDLLLFVGRFDRIKGADLVLRSFAQLAKSRPNIKLLFVGPDRGLAQGTDGSVNFVEFCAKEMPDHVRSRVDYRGTLPRHEIEHLRTKAILTIVASRYETFANVVIEAMSTGCPIVTTSVGGIPEIASHNRNALLVAPDSVDSLSEAIAKLLDDPALATNLGRQAALDCEELLNPAAIAQRTVDFYSSVIEKATGATSQS
jgi:glycosyltransferase involved in cell wall biosynthesis